MAGPKGKKKCMNMTCPKKSLGLNSPLNHEEVFEFLQDKMNMSNA